MSERRQRSDGLLDELACQGYALIVVSSELPEVISLSRRILVMREGAVVAELGRQEFSQEQLMRWMAGRELIGRDIFPFADNVTSFVPYGT
jgi:ABC-type sugar transport system ATPase subunit